MLFNIWTLHMNYWQKKKKEKYYTYYLTISKGQKSWLKATFIQIPINFQFKFVWHLLEIFQKQK